MEEKQAQEQDQADLLPPGRRIGTKSEYARHRGCAPSAVTRAIADRRISTVTISGKELVDFSAADAQWASATRFRRDATPPAPRGPSPLPGGRDELAEVRLRRERADMERAELRRDVEAGALVELAVVEKVLADLGTTLRGTLQDLPHRLAGELVGQPLAEVSTALAEAMDRTLNDICDKMRQLSDGVPEQGTLLQLAPADLELPAYPPEDTAP